MKAHRLIAIMDIGKNFAKLIFIDKETAGKLLEEKGTELTSQDIINSGLRIGLDTKYSEVSSYSEQNTESSICTEFEGKTYIVGSSGTIDSEDLSKSVFIHKLIAYASIAKAIETLYPDDRAQVDVDVILACQADEYKVDETRKKYEEFISGSNKSIEIKINNGEARTFTIKNLETRAEGSGFYLQHRDRISNYDNVLVIDNGGLNTTYNYYTNGSTNVSENFAEKLGFLRMKNLFKEKIKTSSFSKGELNDSLIQKAFINDGIKRRGVVDQESKEIIDTCKKQFIEEMLKKSEHNGKSYEFMDKVFLIGGTSSIIANQINDENDGTNPEDPFFEIINNSQWVSVEGLFILALATYLNDQE